jgi:hypothetical protein
VRQIAIGSKAEGAFSGLIQAKLDLTNGGLLTGQVPIRVAGGFLKIGHSVEAEAIASETGGKVKIRPDKPGVRGKAISHWDDKGHAISWTVDVPKAGRYALVVRHSTPKVTKRKLTLNGQAKGVIAFPATGGFGTAAYEWDHAPFGPYALPAGKTTIRLENTDEHGLNLDYLALVPAE